LVTLDAGQKILEQVLDRAAAVAGAAEGTVSGADAFMLYDTFGFPLEVTQEAAAERGVAVDVDGFEQEMAAQRARSKDAAKSVDMTAGGAGAAPLAAAGATEFVGFSDLRGSAAVLALARGIEVLDSAEAGQFVDVVLDRTPFYAESGGQVGDRGVLVAAGPNGLEAALLLVNDVQKAAGGSVFVHKCEVQSGRVAVGQSVTAQVDEARRRRARTNHTATHLLQSALKQVLGADTSQQVRSFPFRLLGCLSF
jgi:alanyl-tRNA synthetase